MVIATTTKPEALDPVMLNRFTTVTFTYPRTHERKEYIKKELEKRTVSTAIIDLDTLALETTKTTYYDIGNLLKNAFATAHMRSTVLTHDIIEEIIDRELRRIRINSTLPELEAHTLAVSIAGQIIAHQTLQPYAQLTKATILPTADTTSYNAGKLFTYIPDTLIKGLDVHDLRKRCIIALAGNSALTLIAGSNLQIEENIKQALEHASAIAYQGRDERYMSKEAKEEARKQIAAIIQECTIEANRLLLTHKANLIKLAQALEQRYILSIQEINALLAQQ